MAARPGSNASANEAQDDKFDCAKPRAKYPRIKREISGRMTNNYMAWRLGRLAACPVCVEQAEKDGLTVVKREKVSDEKRAAAPQSQQS